MGFNRIMLLTGVFGVLDLWDKFFELIRMIHWEFVTGFFVCGFVDDCGSPCLVPDGADSCRG